MRGRSTPLALLAPLCGGRSRGAVVAALALLSLLAGLVGLRLLRGGTRHRAAGSDPHPLRAPQSLQEAVASAASAAGPRLLVMTSSSCSEFAAKPWIAEPHSTPRGVLYDLVVFDYSADGACAAVVKPHAHTRLVHAPKTFKWPAVARMLHDEEAGASALTFSPRLGPHLLASHDYFFLADDDIDVPGGAAGLAELARVCREAGLYICQPALSAKSAVNMAITQVVEGTHAARATGFVEQMAPLFSRDALMQFLPYFAPLTHGWGIDALWSELASDVLGLDVGVVDAVVIDHMRPSGVSNLYKRVGGIEKAEAERAEFRARFKLGDAVFARMEASAKGAGRKIDLEAAAGA